MKQSILSATAVTRPTGAHGSCGSHENQLSIATHGGSRVGFGVAVALFSLGSAVTPQALAQGVENDLLTINITASGFAETVDESLVAVTVITRKDIEDSQSETVEEVLRGVPGVSLGNSGGVGKLTSLFLRGTNSDHVLVLIDGVKVGSATAGTTPFEHLPLDLIEKIEVVRGPRSSLYGSEAIGGVIQIFTRRGDGGAQVSTQESVGSHNAVKFNVNTRGGDADGWFNLGISHVSTDGYNACRASASAGCFLPEERLERDDDGYRRSAVNLRVGATLEGKVSVEGSFLKSDGETEFDGTFQNESDTTTQVIGFKASVQANENWERTLHLSQSQDESQNHINCDLQVRPLSFEPCHEMSGVLSIRNRFDTTRQQAKWQNDLRVGNSQRLFFGLDYLKDKVDSSTNFSVRERDNKGAFLLWRFNGGFNDWEVALRRDNNEQFDEHSTGSVAWGRTVGSNSRLTLSYGSAFSAPTFNDLYNPNAPSPNLKPENSKNLEFGISGRNSRGRWSVNVFQNEIDELINLDSSDMFRAKNISKAEISGLELTLAQRFGDWDIGFSATAQNPKDASTGANRDKFLARRPKQTMRLDFARQLGRHRFGGELFARSRAYDDPGNTRPIPGFATLNLRWDTRLGKRWSLKWKINNATDKQYETVAYYPQDGRNFLVTLSYRN